MKRVFCLLILFSGIFVLQVNAQESLLQMRSTKIIKSNGKNYYIHNVKKGQTLYMISKAYDVDINEIIQENPEVKQGLKSGQKLRIPAPKSAEVPRKQVKPNPDESKKANSGEEAQLPCGKDKSFLKATYNVALLMPLYLSEVGQMDVNIDPDAAPQENNPLQFVEYYEGFRLAIDSLEKTGVSVKVKVYDAERDTMKTIKLLQDTELKNMDLIFGIMYPHNFQIVSDFAEKNNIPIVNPISERDQIIEKHKNVYKVRPSLKFQFSELVTYLLKNYKDSNVVVISDNQRMNKATANNIMSTLTDKMINVHLADGYGEVLGLLATKKGNVVILISSNKSFVLDVITKLNEHRNEFGITLLGLPRWDRFDDIEADYLVNLKTLVMAPYFVDYDDKGVKQFVSQFQNRYQTDPDALAFQGFDVTYYFLSALWKFGTSFERCLPELRLKSMQTDFRFTRAKENGFENSYWEMWQYDHYRLRRISLPLIN